MSSTQTALAKRTHRPSATELDTVELWVWSEDAHPDYVTQVYAIMGRRGSGKTYGAGVLAETMIEDGQQTIILDPVGNWWGLRVAADGVGKGYSIPVLGGEHGDLPLPVDAGVVVADMLVDTGSSVVLDLSEMRKGERKKFVTDFAEQFFHRKKKARSACHIFVEEAHLFLPQHAAKGEERMLGALEDLARLGRNYGIGMTLIDQRPQSVSKDALNQAECLAVFQLVGPQERDAIKRWTQQKEATILDELGALSSLGQGECYLWSPQWLRVMVKTKFAPKKTYDASATPKGGRATAAVDVVPIDLAKLSHAMQSAIETAKTNDPKRLHELVAHERKINGQLKLRIADLELTAAHGPAPQHLVAQIATQQQEIARLTQRCQTMESYETRRTVQIRVIRERVAAANAHQEKMYDPPLRTYNDLYFELGHRMGQVHQAVMAAPTDPIFGAALDAHVRNMDAHDDTQVGQPPTLNTGAAGTLGRTVISHRKITVPAGTAIRGASAVPYSDTHDQLIHAPRTGVHRADELGGKRGPDMAILTTLKTFRRPMTTRQLAVLTGRADRTVRNILVELRKARVVRSEGDTHYLEPAGGALVPAGTGRVTAADRIEMWRRQLDAGARTVLDVLIEAHRKGRREGLTTGQIASHTGHAERTVRNCLVVLRGANLVQRGNPHRLNNDLFMEASS